MKRLFDILASALALLLLAPVLLTIAVLVRLASPGPALFRQTRVGLGGRDFTLLKFRTMTVRSDAAGGSFDAGDTSRVTRLGRLLRATKLDELPQFWNVLVGEMSLVGPRPEVRKWVEAYPHRWAHVHTALPGITDPASIIYRYEEDILAASDDPQRTYRQEILPRKLDVYEQYVDHHDLRGDLRILWQTAMAVLFGRGSKPPEGPAQDPHEPTAPGG
jgi:lipopolysaccharide/colanic/teichoic acid biosynthesis glycosyltransferase